MFEESTKVLGDIGLGSRTPIFHAYGPEFIFQFPIFWFWALHDYMQLIIDLCSILWTVLWGLYVVLGI